MSFPLAGPLCLAIRDIPPLLFEKVFRSALLEGMTTWKIIAGGGDSNEIMNMLHREGRG